MKETRVFNPLDLQLSRSVYDWTVHSMGTCLVGRLIPSYTFNVLPGSEFTMSLHSLFKMSTPVYPTMDYLYADIAFFFVPYKLMLSRRYGTPSVNDAFESWEGFIGAQDFAINMPIPASGVELPLVNGTTAKVGGLLEYLYGPDFNADTSTPGIYLNCLPMLTYFSIWNDNYREPSIQTPVTWSFSSLAGGHQQIVPASSPLICLADCEMASIRTTETAGTYVYSLVSGSYDFTSALPLPTSVFHGYFGSLLPWPQRNLSGVSIPIGGFAPLKVGDSFTAFGGLPQLSQVSYVGEGVNLDDTNLNTNALVVAYKTAGNALGIGQAGPSSRSNLGIDLSQASAVDVEMLRALITKQHWYEDLARSGNRLDELEYGTFGVRPKDSGLDRPMYLGGKRIQLNVEMVASTNGGTSATGAQGQTSSGTLGDLGAFSHTNDSDFYFHHGFDTWGAVQCVFTIRTHNLIASGVDRQWLKFKREDWYWPEFANLGNFGVLKGEIAAGGSSPSALTQVLGYQEYAEEWRSPRDMVTGLLVPGRSLGFMTYAHRYDQGSVTLAQVLDASKQWIDVDRTLAVQQSASGFQFIYQFTFDAKARIPVGKYSYPGVSRI